MRLFGNTASALTGATRPEDFEHPEHVRPKLDAGADLLELGRLLDQLRRNALARQRQRRGEPADAATDDDDLPIFPIAHGASVGGIVEGRPLPTSVASAWRTGQGAERACAIAALDCPYRAHPMTAGLIDVHFHLIPQFYRDAVYEAGNGPAIGRYPDWTPALALDLMDNNGIALALLSLGQPGVGFHAAG